MKVVTILPSQKILNELFLYNKSTGIIIWKTRNIKWFKDGKRWSALSQMKRWNTMYSGKEAFTTIGSHGYKASTVLGKQGVLAHRIIWKMVEGTEPSQIDHIDGDKTNNIYLNLRNVNNLVNGWNKKQYCTNTSGTTGVQWNKQAGKWQALIMIKGKIKHLGFHINKEDAIDARGKADIKYGFHKNHGRVA